MFHRWAWLLAAVITTAGAAFGQIEGVQDESEDSVASLSPAIPRTILVVGQVMLQDGSAAFEPVLVEPACNNVILPDTYTDSKGRFSVEIGDASGMMSGSPRASGARPSSANFSPYESEGRRDTTVELRGCELRFESTGFQVHVISLDGSEARSYVDIGVVRLRRHANIEGDSISATTLQAPEKARKRYEKAVKQLRGRGARPDKAIQELQAAVADHPEFAAAWNLLGEIHLKAGEVDGAEKAFGKAVEADPAYIKPYLPLARIAYQLGRWDETVQLSDRIQRLDPYITDAVYLQALAYYQLGRSELAEKSALRVQSSQDARRFPETHYLLGLIRSTRGEFVTAAQDFREYVAARPGSPAAQDVVRQLEEWAALGVIPR